MTQDWVQMRRKERKKGKDNEELIARKAWHGNCKEKRKEMTARNI